VVYLIGSESLRVFMVC